MLKCYYDRVSDIAVGCARWPTHTTSQGLMAPRKTHTGASAATRRTPARNGARATPTSRSRTSAVRPRTTGTAAKRKATRKRAPLQWWTVPVAVVAVLVVFAWAYYPVVRVRYRETREQARLTVELKSIQDRNDRLREQVERLKTPEGVEDYARSQLGLVKEGEHKVVVVSNRAAAAPPVNSSPRIDSDETTASPSGPWTAFLDLVFGVE